MGSKILMKMALGLIIVGSIILAARPSSALAANPAGELTYRCDCFQNVPFESYQIYVVEKKDGVENWILLEPRPRQFDDMATCLAAAKLDVSCQELNKL